MSIELREEVEADAAAVEALHELAFGRAEEARLVRTLRARAHPKISVVAVKEQEVVGHVLLSPVEIEKFLFQPPGLGLGPMAVAPSQRRRGIGAQLVRSGLQRAHRIDTPFVVVLGHPAYYPRFGFERASSRDLYYDRDLPEDAFMVQELRPGALRGVRGRVRYHPAFAGV